MNRNKVKYLKKIIFKWVLCMTKKYFYDNKSKPNENLYILFVI